jgi:hypothetical protein
MKPKRTETQGDKATVLAGITLSRRSTRMPLLAVDLNDDTDVRVGEVDPGDELVPVMDLVLGYRFRKTSAPDKLSEPGLENAAHRPFAGRLAVEYCTYNLPAGAKETAELFPSSEHSGHGEPAAVQPVIEELLETISVDHDAKVKERSQRTSDRDPVDLGQIGGIKATRLVPHDVASSIASAVSERSHLDDAFLTVDKSQQCCGRSM